MHVFDILARAAFGVAGAALMLLALGLVGVAGYQVTQAQWPPNDNTGRVLLDGVALIVGLGVYQRLSAKVEVTAAEPPPEGNGTHEHTS